MPEPQERSNSRKLKRHAVTMAVDVHDAVSDTHLGRLVNIHQEGLMLVGETQLPDNNLYQLELHLPLDLNGRTVVALGVDCLWSRSNNEGTLFWAGCKIIDISDEALADIDALIRTINP